MNIKWRLGPQSHPLVGELVPGQKYDVPEELGKAWCEQGAAEPESADKAVKTSLKNEGKE